MRNRLDILLAVCGIFFFTPILSQDDSKYEGAVQTENEVPDYTLPDLLTPNES